MMCASASAGHLNCSLGMPSGLHQHEAEEQRARGSQHGQLGWWHLAAPGAEAWGRLFRLFSGEPPCLQQGCVRPGVLSKPLMYLY